MKSLKFIPRPYTFESPTSLLIRTAKKNGFTSVMHMCRNLPIRHRQRILPMYLITGSLYELLCGEAPEFTLDLHTCFYQQNNHHLSRVSPISIHGHEVSSRLISYEFRPCPLCVADGYTRFTQDLKSFDDCPFHQIPFVTNCSKCGEISRWYEINGFTCRCGQSFDTLNTSQLPPRPYCASTFGPHGLALMLNIAEKAYNTRARFSNYFLHSLLPPACSPQYMKRVIINDIQKYGCLPISAFEAPWLTTMNPALRSQALDLVRTCYHKHQSNQCGKCCDDVWMTLPELCETCLVSRPRMLRLIQNNAFTYYRNSNQEPYYSTSRLCDWIRDVTPYRINLNNANTADNEFYSASQLAEMLVTNFTSVLALIKMGVFEGVQKIDRKFYIPKQSAADFRKQYILASEIAAQNGLSCKTVSVGISNAGIQAALDSIGDWLPAFYLKTEINKLSPEQLLCLRRKYVCKKNEERPWLASKAHELHLQPILLRDLMLNHLKFDPPLHKITGDQIQAIHKWRASHHTIPEVCVELKINRSLIVSRFIRTNFITCSKLQRTSFISSSDVLKIGRHLESYCSIQETAQRLSIGINKIRELAGSGKIKADESMKIGHRSQIMIIK